MENLTYDLIKALQSTQGIYVCPECGDIRTIQDGRFCSKCDDPFDYEEKV